MSRHFVDVTLKAGYAPYRKDNSWQQDLVAIRVPNLDGDGETGVACPAINGIHYNVPRGEDVKVPRLIKENLETRFQHKWAMPGNNAMQGMVYLGKHSRFYVIELSGDRADKAVEVKPAGPIAADQRVALESALIKSATEDAVARSEIKAAQSQVHDDLK